MLYVTVQNFLPLYEYELTLVGFKFVMSNPDGRKVEVYVSNGAGIYKPAKVSQYSKTLIDRAVQITSPGTSLVEAGEGSAGFVITSLLVAIDASGTLFRVAQVFKMIGKLCFVNVNFGDRLDYVLSESGTKNRYDPDKPKNIQVFNSAGTHGKLTTKKMTLVGTSMPKFLGVSFFYCLLWVIRIAQWYLMSNYQLDKAGLTFFYYSNKVHIVLFNVFLSTSCGSLSERSSSLKDCPWC